MSWLTACRTASSWQVVRHSLSQPSLGVSAVNEQRRCWDWSSELNRLREAFHIPGERRSAWTSITTQHAKVQVHSTQAGLRAHSSERVSDRWVCL